MVTMDNTEGLADGNFQLVEIRSGQSGNSLSKFDETNSKSSEIIPQDVFSAEHVEDELIVIFKTDAEQFENAENFSGNIQVLRTCHSKDPWQQCSVKCKHHVPDQKCQRFVAS